MAKTLGAILIAVGILTFAIQGISYTTQEEVVDIGPLKVTTEDEKTISLPPIFGGLALVGGVVLVALGTRRS